MHSFSKQIVPSPHNAITVQLWSRFRAILREYLQAILADAHHAVNRERVTRIGAESDPIYMEVNFEEGSRDLGVIVSGVKTIVVEWLAVPKVAFFAYHSEQTHAVMHLYHGFD